MASSYNALEREYPVKLEPTEAQLTLFDDYQCFELDFKFDGVVLLCYVPNRVVNGETANEVLWVHWHGGAHISELFIVARCPLTVSDH